MSRVFEVSEIFLSLEGEATYANQPTVYTRFARCQFKCSGFNNLSKSTDQDGYAPLTFNPINIQSLKDVPMIDCGCDSQYAVNPKFSHIWEKLTADQIVNRLLDLLPGNNWQHPKTGLNYIYSITGGEPLLQWKFLPEILFHEKMINCKHIIFETNGAVPVKQEFFDNVATWIKQVPGRKWTWSVSPKLSDSGEQFDKAIKPEIVEKMRNTPGSELYLKFVAGPYQSQFDEIEVARNMYGNQDIVWIMPTACTKEQQQEIAKHVAQMCIEQGYCFSYRIQNDLWDNVIGS